MDRGPGARWANAHRTARLLARVPGAAAVRWRLSVGHPSVAITFDDGPDPDGTPLILDLLAAAGVTATFFVLAERVRSAPALVRRLLLENHAVGLHGDVHERLDRESQRSLVRRLSDARAAMEDVAGREITMHRPPFGRVSLSLLRAARRVGLEVVLWSHDPRDWDGSAERGLAQRVADSVAADAIVLLHDGSPAQATRTAAALGDLGGILTSRGLRAVTLPGR